MRVWEDAHRLTLEVYKITKDFPIRRASVSISSNIAEGCGRGSNKDYANFLQIALGSAFEVDYQLLLARDLNYLEAEVYLILSKNIDGLKRQLAALLQKVKDAS